MAFDLATTHLDADADGLGGLVALHLLEGPLHLGLPGGMDPTAARLWADHAEHLPPLLHRAELEHRIAEEPLGRLLVADAGRPDRLGWLADHVDRFAEVVAWDTHPVADGDLPRAPVEAAGAATSPLVLALAARGVTPSPVEAGVMLVAIHVDTGHFTFPSTSAVDHEAAARCLAWGADPRWPARYAPRGFTAHQLRLLEAMADHVRLVQAAGLTLALIELELEAYEPDLSTLLSQLREAESWAAVVLTTSTAGKISVIGRSDGSVDMGALCVELGGGGHRAAASAVLQGVSLDEARALVLSAARQVLHAARCVSELAIRRYVSMSAGAPISRAADLLHEHRINAMPLTQGEGSALRVVGLVNRQDVEAALRHGLGDEPASTISARVPGRLPPDAPLVEAQRHFAHQGGRLLMVAREGEPPEAILTRTGLLRELAAQVQPPRSMRPPHPRILKGLLRKHLGWTAWPRVEQAGAIGAELGFSVHLVGGAVRDLLLEHPVQDVDLVVEGDARALARALAERHGGEVTEHAAFGTAKWHAPGSVTVDLAGARAEVYRGRATLPEVVHAALQRDLGRRDFTVNAMAVSVTPDDLGALVDPHGGYADLKQGLLRVLHGLSFHDDPTRAFRAARFAGRFAFRLAEDTAGLLRAAVRAGALEHLGQERLGAEVDRLLAERAVVECLRHLQDWRLLTPLHAGMQLNADRLDEVRRVVAGVHQLQGQLDHAPGQAEALWILLGRLVPAEDRAACQRMVPGARPRQESWSLGPDHVDRALQRVSRARRRQGQARALRGLTAAELAVVLGLAEAATVAERVQWWVRDGRHVAPAFDGRRLLAEGVPQGPALGRALEAARGAAWDGEDEAGQLSAALRSAAGE